MFSQNGNIDILPPSAVAKDPTRPLPSDDLAIEDDGQATSSIDLPKAASYTSLPSMDESALSNRIKRTFSENVLAIPEDIPPGPNGSHYAPSKEVLRRMSLTGNQKKTESAPSPSKQAKAGKQPTLNGSAKTPVTNNVELSKPSSRSVSGTIRRLARKSWLSPSRSPSPSREDKESKRREKMKRKSFSKSTSDLVMQSTPAGEPSNSVSVPSEPPSGAKQSSPSRPGTMRRMSTGRRPLSAILSRSKTENDWEIPRSPSVQSLRSLRSKHSSDSLLVNKNVARMPSVKVPPLPTNALSDKGSSLSVDLAKKKDPLWGAFRSLEGDFQKYAEFWLVERF